MNAHTLTTPAVAPILTVLAVQNMPLLEALSLASFESVAELAQNVGRDTENARKSLKAMRDAGLLDWPQGSPLPHLSPAGSAAVDAWARAEGRGPALELEIPCDLIEPWPDQPRRAPDPEFVEELADNIDVDDIQQALTVRPHPDPAREGRFQVIIGETRRQAALKLVARGRRPAGWAIPCRVRVIDDAKAFELALAENVQRDDLPWIDEAKAAFKLAEPPFSRSAAEISRIFGGRRGKRSLNDYVAIVRKLPADVLEKAYLPPKIKVGNRVKDNPEHLTYTQAREMVAAGATERPALALSKREACALLEAVAVATADDPEPLPRPGAVLAVPLHAAPTGGPFRTLEIDHGLMTFGFAAGRQLQGRIKVTDDLVRWLKQLGWPEDRAIALRKARADVLGDIQAAALHREGRFASAELNPPSPPPFTGEVAAQPPEGATPPADEDEDPEVPAFLRRLAGPGEAPSAAAPSSSPVAQTTGEVSPPTTEGATEGALPPLLALIVSEAAFHIGEAGTLRAPGDVAAPILATWHKDMGLAALIRDHKFLAVVAAGERTLIRLLPPGVAWLQANNTRFEPGSNRPIVDLDWLAKRQAHYAGREPAARFHTPWLPGAAPAPAPPPPAGEVSPPATEGAQTTTSAEGAGDLLPPSQRRVLREIAARSFHRTRLPDDAVAAHSDCLADPDWIALHDLHLVIRFPSGNVALTREGVHHLKTHGQMPEAKSANSCTTPWLREDYTPAPRATAAEAFAAPPPAPTRDDPAGHDAPLSAGPDTALAEAADQLAAARRILGAQHSLLGQLDGLIGRLRQKASKDQQGEIDQYRALIVNTRDAAQPFV